MGQMQESTPHISSKRVVDEIDYARAQEYADELSSKVVGLDVYNSANQNIGTIKDVAYNGTSVNGYVIGVGGFLGMGDHYIAVRPSAVKLNYDAKDKKWHASMDANADQLKAAPEYKYPSNS